MSHPFNFLIRRLSSAAAFAISTQSLFYKDVPIIYA